MTPNPPPTVSSDDLLSSDDPKVHLNKIEELARVLLEKPFDNTKNLWRFQVDLLNLQRDIQRDIGKFKSRGRRDKTSREPLSILRHTRWSARNLGDAFAWIVLGLNRQFIYSLTQNSPVAVAAEEDHGSRGLIEIAKYLANEGWGFPLLHDVTDCLRIGDLTFVNSTRKNGRSFQTVEAKTRVVSGESDEQGLITYDVTLVSPAPFGEPVRIERTNGHEAGTQVLPSKTPPSQAAPHGRQDRRLERQLERMSKALHHQSAEIGKITEMPGGLPLLSLKVEGDADDHWAKLREVIDRSRNTGYASECVDKAMLYVALYAPEGISEETVQTPQLPIDVTESGI